MMKIILIIIYSNLMVDNIRNMEIENLIKFELFSLFIMKIIILNWLKFNGMYIENMKN